MIRWTITALAVAISANFAWAQSSNCAPRAQVLERLVSDFGESVTFEGLFGQGIFELHLSTETGTWTATVTLPTGVTCVFASGQGGFHPQMPSPGIDG